MHLVQVDAKKPFGKSLSDAFPKLEAKWLRKFLGINIEVVCIESSVVDHFLSFQINVYLAVNQVVKLETQVQNIRFLLIRRNLKRVFSEVQLIMNCNRLSDLLALVELQLSLSKSFHLLRLQLLHPLVLLVHLQLSPISFRPPSTL